MKANFIIAILIFFFLSEYNPALSQNTIWKAPDSANDIKNPFAGDEAATLKGKKLFNQMCAICHGTKGKGDGMAGASLYPKPSDFLDTNIKNESDGAIFWKITNGKPPMAAYKDVLSEEQRWYLVNYLRKLEKTK